MGKNEKKIKEYIGGRLKEISVYVCTRHAGQSARKVGASATRLSPTEIKTIDDFDEFA